MSAETSLSNTIYIAQGCNSQFIEPWVPVPAQQKPDVMVLACNPGDKDRIRSSRSLLIAEQVPSQPKTRETLPQKTITNRPQSQVPGEGFCVPL